MRTSQPALGGAGHDPHPAATPASRLPRRFRGSCFCGCGLCAGLVLESSQMSKHRTDSVQTPRRSVQGVRAGACRGAPWEGLGTETGYMAG